MDFQQRLSTALEDEQIYGRIVECHDKIKEILGFEVNLMFTPSDEETAQMEEQEQYQQPQGGMDAAASYGYLLRELLDEGIDVNEKSIFMSGGIDEHTLDFLDARFRLLTKLQGAEDPITLYLNSYGGEAYSMFAICDLMKEYKVNVVGRGKIMSAGALITIAGSHRVMYPSSCLMLHNLQSRLDGDFKDIAKNFKHLELLQDLMFDILVRKSNKGRTWWKKNLTGELYLTPKDALKYALIDEIKNYE